MFLDIERAQAPDFNPITPARDSELWRIKSREALPRMTNLRFFLDPPDSEERKKIGLPLDLVDENAGMHNILDRTPMND
jgi:hypothetical protein